MLTEEHGLQLEGADPVRAGAVTFAAFLGVGLVPLLPYLAPGIGDDTAFAASGVMAAAAFWGIGWVKGQRLQLPRLRSAWQTLWTGGAAAALAYGTGWALQALFGAGY